MLSTALPRSNSFNDEALARSYHPGKVILNSSCWIYQCNLGWLVCDWCPLMVLGSAGWILMALDDSLWDLISDKCWCLIHLILGLMKVLMTLLMFATHELPARSSTNAADAKAKASTPPSPRGKAPALPSSLAPPKGATGSKASSKASTAPSPKSKASPSPSPKAKALTLTVPKAQSKAQAAPVSPRSALAKAMAPKAKASGQHSDGVGRANLIFLGLIEDHTQNSAFWFKIQFEYVWVSQVAVESLTLAPISQLTMNLQTISAIQRLKALGRWVTRPQALHHC